MTVPCARRVALAGAALAAVLLAGCGGGLSAGPLNGGDGRTGFCGPALDPHRVFTAGGIAQVKNPGLPAVIDRFSLSHLRGLRLLDAWAVPVRGSAVGNWNGLPDPRQTFPQWRQWVWVPWRHRRPIDGAGVPRTHANAGPHRVIAVDLVFLVKLVDRTGGFDGVDLYYHNPNGHYHLHISNSLGLAAPKNYTRYCSQPPQ